MPAAPIIVLHNLQCVIAAIAPLLSDQKEPPPRGRGINTDAGRGAVPRENLQPAGTGTVVQMGSGGNFHPILRIGFRLIWDAPGIFLPRKTVSGINARWKENPIILGPRVETKVKPQSHIAADSFGHLKMNFQRMPVGSLRTEADPGANLSIGKRKFGVVCQFGAGRVFGQVTLVGDSEKADLNGLKL